MSKVRILLVRPIVAPAQFILLMKPRHHRITSSARCSSDDGIVSASAVADRLRMKRMNHRAEAQHYAAPSTALLSTLFLRERPGMGTRNLRRLTVTVKATQVNEGYQYVASIYA